MKCHAVVFMNIFDKLIIKLEFTEMDSVHLQNSDYET